MTQFAIDVKNVTKAMEELDGVISKMNSHYVTMQDIKSSLSPALPQMKKSLDTVMEQFQGISQATRKLKTVGQQIAEEIMTTEGRICANQITLKEILEAINDSLLTSEEQKEIEDEINALLSSNSDVMKMSDADKQRLIELYEKLYPSQGRNMESVLEPLVNAGDDDHAQNIKVLAYTAEEPYRSFFLNNVGDVNILDLDCNETQHYNSGTDGVYLDIDEWKDETNPTSKTYLTFFHECSHAIDYHSGVDGDPYTVIYMDASGNTLNDAIESNVRQDINSSATDYLNGLGYSNEEKANITSEVEKAIMNCADINEPGGSPTFCSVDAKDCYDAVVKDISSTTFKSSSDVYGGMTGNTLRNSSGHVAVRTNSEGIKWSYWTNGSYDSVKQVFVPDTESDGSLSYKPSIGKEFFAENMATHMTRDADEIKGVNVYSQDTRDYFDDLVNSIQN